MKSILEDDCYWDSYNKDIKEVLEKLSIENLRHKKFQWVEKNDKIGLRTFKGTKINNTLQLLLNMFNEGFNYELEDRETFISGPHIREAIEKVKTRNFTEDEIFIYLKDNPEIVELYLSSNKYRILLPDNLKIKYIIYNKLDLEGVRAYIGV